MLKKFIGATLGLALGVHLLEKPAVRVPEPPSADEAIPSAKAQGKAPVTPLDGPPTREQNWGVKALTFNQPAVTADAAIAPTIQERIPAPSMGTRLQSRRLLKDGDEAGGLPLGRGGLSAQFAPSGLGGSLGNMSAGIQERLPFNSLGGGGSRRGASDLRRRIAQNAEQTKSNVLGSVMQAPTKAAGAVGGVHGRRVPAHHPG